MADDEGRDETSQPGTGSAETAAPQPPPNAPAPPNLYGFGPPPGMPAANRVLGAAQRRSETDYIFSYWTALGWTILTLGIYSLYVFYQLVRRMRDHNARRLELLDSALAFGWEEAGRRGLQGELTPSFQRASAHMDVLRRMTTDFREPAIWLVLAIVARGIAEIIAFILLDQDLVKHDGSEAGLEYELSLIYGRFGQALPVPTPDRARRQNSYVGRILATVFSLGIYLFWWYYNQMTDPNEHFQANWPQEDALVGAINALR